MVLLDVMRATSGLLEVMTFEQDITSCYVVARSVEHTRKTLIVCIEQGVKYTGINVKKSMVDLTFYILLLK